MSSKTKNLITSSCIIVILSTLPLYVAGYYVSLLITILMYATLGVGWIIISGYAGYISLGSVGFFGIGCYIAATFWPILPLPILIILGGLASAIFALIVGFPALRIRGPYFIMLTFGLAELVRYSTDMYQTQVKGFTGMVLIDAPSMQTLYYCLLVVAVVAVAIAQVIKNSKFGLGLFSIKGDEEAAEATGVNTVRYKLIAFSISSSFMGCVGVIMALRWGWIEPVIAFSPMISFQVVIMCLLGGLTDFRGPILGAVALTLIAEIFGVKFPYYYTVILGIALVLLVKFLPKGLLGTMEGLRRSKKPYSSQTNTST